MSDLSLNIAASGLTAQQAAIDTISENLANANTPGYVSETAVLRPNPGGDLLGVGDGVSVTGIDQNGDSLLMTNVLQSQGALSQSTALQQVLQGVEAAFPEPNGSGIANDLSTFWQSWDAVAQDPSNPAPRAQVVDLAQNLATDFNQASTQLDNLEQNAQSQLTSVVGQANTMLAQVASLNQRITAFGGSGTQANALIDQRNQVMTQLASAIGAVAVPQGDGSINVNVGGITLVQGNWNDTLSLTGSPGSLAITTTSTAVAIPASSGTASGLMAALNQYLPAYGSQLDASANALASTVNNQLAAGYTATGASGAGYPLFSGSGAAGLTVNPAVAADTSLIAASGTSTLPNAVNDGSNAQAMAELYNSATGPDQAYQTFIQGMGSQVQAVNSQVQSQTSVSTAASQNLASVAGVNTNDQMVQLLAFQQAFQASAKLISSVDTMMQSLIQAT